jgi:hypothetical protein
MHEFAVAQPRQGRHAQNLPRHARLGQRREPVSLAQHVQALAD